LVELSRENTWSRPSWIGKTDDGSLWASRRFCLTDGQEAEASLCLAAQYRRCGIRLFVEDFRPMDCVMLNTCGSADCRTHVLLCSGEVRFVGLCPGVHLLTLCRPGCRPVRLVIQLPPGANAEVQGSVWGGNWRWYPDSFRYAWNRRERQLR